jgi:superfamily II DNA/RNA helicase
MRPEEQSQSLLGVTRSKAKMLEYGVPEEHHIKIKQDPSKLFTISIGLLGDISAAINRNESDPDSLYELKNNLLFSARFFDSYLNANLNNTLDPYLILLGSASYYLCDLPGSSSVLANYFGDECPDLDCDGLESLLLWLLQFNLKTYFEDVEGPFGKLIERISKKFLQFFEDGTDEEHLRKLAIVLRETVYRVGTPRQLLFGDVIVAVMSKKLENSAWNALPLYSGLSRDNWLPTLQKESFIKEFWPAQHLMGKENVLKGKSAIVQMPTSAGKTKATELILRSAFLGDRTSLAIIIAPFRALCHEIKNSLTESFHSESIEVDELSDALQTDFEIAELVGHHQVLVVTPEKLLYVLRHAPELSSYVGLLVFDEGHQFDSGTRGITYELLLTSLRFMIPDEAQKVLISAVLSNAKAVGEWLNGEPNVVEGTSLIPTFRSVGFASWLDQLGRIEYVDNLDAEHKEFFVPRVIESFNLGRKGSERKDRYFPKKNDGQTIALYLGLKLVPNGSIAVFCGRKSTAASICEKAIDFIERGVPFALPSEFSNSPEIERLTHLHVENIGTNSPASKCATNGIFPHHGNMPHGIRLAVEYAMGENLIKFVVCTSTLAQGVNLPIRYLIVTSVYQGMDRIKVRDFQNLIGRAGRAGKHTEGSILFADPIIYDKRRERYHTWRWNQVKELLDPRNSEPCISNLLYIFEPIKSDDEKYFIPMEALDFVNAYISDPDDVAQLAADIAERHKDKGFSQRGVERQIAWRISLICAVENFLLSHWEDTDGSLSESDVILLAEGTLAFFLADSEKKEHIRELFKILAQNISEKITDTNRRRIYGKTLYGVQDAQAIEQWFNSNYTDIFSVVDNNELLNLIWPLFVQQVKEGIFIKFDNYDVLKEVVHGWIYGRSFVDLHNIIRTNETKMIRGTQRREFKIDHVVELCEGNLAYDCSLVIGALCEFVSTQDHDRTEDLINHLQLFQKRLKYGLPTETDIALYELGFSDRVISQDLTSNLNLTATKKTSLIKAMQQNRDDAMEIIDKYPAYFRERMNELVS